MLVGVDKDSIPLDSSRDKFNWSAGKLSSNNVIKLLFDHSQCPLECFV